MAECAPLPLRLVGWPIKMICLAAKRVTWFQLAADDMARAWAFHGRVFGRRPDEIYADRKRLGAINGDFAPRGAE